MAERDLYGTALAWAEGRDARIGRHNPWSVAVRVTREMVADRVSGLAAEMAFWSLLSLVPLTVSLGAALGYAELVVGRDQVVRAQGAVIRGLAIIFSPRLTSEVIAPFVRELLSQQRGGLAAGGLAVSLYLASRVFTATMRALDLAYRVPERRGVVAQRVLALVLAIGFVLVVVATLVFAVVGPLLGSARSLATRLGFGTVFEVGWEIGRWPLLFGVVIVFLGCVYRFGPNVDNGWRHCLPGAVLGLTLWVLASLSFRLYLAAGGANSGVLVAEDEAVALVGRAVGALVATIVWTYLTAMAILVGGELNAELARS
ncbi:MAG: YihY/virulence factor BrkB family protein [Euzebyales bacterium]|nr:YihY/virulence factor BrkB family protein [Euzebyales bacterium]